MARTLPWSDDRVLLLTQLWADGASAAAIARTLGGTTRNAVIGKIHRLGLSGRRPAPRPGRPPPRGRRRARSPARVERPRPVTDAPPPSAPADPALPGLADVASVARHACRWPIGDPKHPAFALCGRPAVRGAYCAAHGAVAYRPVRDDLLKLAGLR